MNNRGMTLIELITTFALSAVIIILLINVLVVIRNVYSKSTIKTELYINQANLSNALNRKINKNNLSSYESCDDSTFCYEFSFKDGTITKLIVNKNYIKFGNTIYKLDSQTKVVNSSLNIEYIDSVNHNNILVLKIPVKNEIYPNIDFGINLVYLYNVD